MPNPPLTEEEYLRLDRLAETRSEFHNGQMFAMAGASPNHSLLANSIGSILRTQVPAMCGVYNADLRIHIAAVNTYTYADCSVICGELQFSGDREDCVLNPALIVEVLSPSTENYDRGRKFELYRTILSFQDYLLVHQDRIRVEHYSRQNDGSWSLRDYAGPAASLYLQNLGVEISLSDLYARITPIPQTQLS